VFRYIPQPTAGVVLALLLGERQNLDRGIIQQFQKTGIVHVLAISGLHIGFILMIFLLVLGFLPISYQLRIGLALVLLLLFIALIGFKASAVRAGLMAAFYFASRFLERRVPPLNILAVAGLVIVLPFPQQALTPGFQFSFAAVGGILFGYPHLKQLSLFKKGPHRVQRFIIQPFLVSLCAVLATTPLTWWYYGSLQTGAVLINIVLIPFIGGLVALGFLFLLLPPGFTALLAGLGQLIHFYFTGIRTVNAWFARWPFVQIQMGKPELWLLIGVIFLVLLLLHATKQSISAAVILAFFIFLSYSATPAYLQVTYVNVHQGDGAILRFPNEKTVVIDGGDRNQFMDAGTRYMVPVLRYYGIRHINYLVGTHPHSDHIGGLLAIMNSFSVDTLVLSRYANKTELYRQLLQTAHAHHVPISHKQRGDRLFLGANFRAYVLHPYGRYVHPKTYSGNEINNSSLVIQVLFGQTGFLFTGDLEQNAEPELFSYKSLLHCDVLKVGHHGSKTSSGRLFLNLAQPRFSVISVGRHNKFFHPSKKTVARLRRLGAHPLRTDHFGALVFQSDGQRVQPVFWR
jgi:competence protein ComEC